MKKVFLLVSLFFYSVLSALQLKPGFDKSEYIQLLEMGAKYGDSAYQSKIPDPTNFKKIYRSREIGLANCWDLWTNNNGIAVTSIRGTVANSESWLVIIMQPWFRRKENYIYQIHSISNMISLQIPERQCMPAGSYVLLFFPGIFFRR